MLEAFEPVLIRTPRETSQAKNRKNLPTTYGGVRQTCMHAEMATATSASMAAVGIGSNRINAAPRRGGEIHRYHASFGLRHTCSTNTTACRCFFMALSCTTRCCKWVSIPPQYRYCGGDGNPPAISHCTVQQYHTSFGL